MKKLILVVIIAIYSSLTFATSREVKIKISNQTASNFEIVENNTSNCSSCIFCHDEKIELPSNKTVPMRNETQIHKNYYVGCGVFGSVKLKTVVNGKICYANISYSRPLIGSDEINYSVDPPFEIYLDSKTYGGIGGDMLNAVFRLEVGIKSPIALPQTGNNQIEVNILFPKEESRPKTNSLMDAFNINVKAASHFYPRNDYNAIYNNQKGGFGGSVNVGTTKYTATTLPNGDLLLKAIISNLPENIPLVVSTSKKDSIEWTEVKKNDNVKICQNARYLVVLDKQNDFNYTIESGWYCDEQTSGVDPNGIGGKIMKLKNAKINPADIKENNLIFNNNILTNINSTGVLNIKTTPIIKPTDKKVITSPTINIKNKVKSK